MASKAIRCPILSCYIITKNNLNFYIQISIEQMAKKGNSPKEPESPRSPTSPSNPDKIKKRNRLNLNNIIEVTEQNYTHRLHEQTSENISLKSQQIVQTSFWVKSLACIKNICKCFQSGKQISMNVREQELIRTIEKLKSEKNPNKIYLPPLKQKKKTLVLDLDGTLLYSTFQQPEHYDFKTQLPFKHSKIEIFTELRFGVESFLFEMSKIYELVLYTVRKEMYTAKMLEVIDKKHWISHILHKDKCITLNKVHHLKNIKFLGRNPQDVIFLDHDSVSGILQPQNFCQIKCFNGQKNDRQLIKIMPFLKELSKKKSVTPVFKHHEQFKNREIQIQFLNLETTTYDSSPQKSSKRRKSTKMMQEMKQNYIEEKKKKYRHKKNNSEVESLAKKIEEENNQHEESGCQLKMRDGNRM